MHHVGCMAGPEFHVVQDAICFEIITPNSKLGY